MIASKSICNGPARECHKDGSFTVVYHASDGFKQLQYRISLADVERALMNRTVVWDSNTNTLNYKTVTTLVHGAMMATT